jgi:uncharacterized protein
VVLIAVADAADETPFAHLPYALDEASAFVREVLLPGGPHVTPAIAPGASRFALSIAPSLIHRHGVFADADIPADEVVIEYTGERISAAEGSRRSLRPRLYLFWVDEDLMIDGAVGGSGAEFVNHGCEPNIAARVQDGRIHFVSLRAIAPGEELLIDYKVNTDAPPMPCSCGSAHCRGFLNLV